MSADPRQLKRALRQHLANRHADQNWVTRLLMRLMSVEQLARIHVEDHWLYTGKAFHKPDDLRAWALDPEPGK